MSPSPPRRHLRRLVHRRRYYVVQAASRPLIPQRRCSRAMVRRRLPPTRIVTISPGTIKLYPEREIRSAFAASARFDRPADGSGSSLFGQPPSKSFTPVVTNSSSVVTSAGATLKIPAEPILHPFNTDLTDFNYRTNFGHPGSRRDLETANLQTGVEGRLGAIGRGIGHRLRRNTVKVVSRNQVKADDLQRRSTVRRGHGAQSVRPSESQRW